MVIGTEYLRRVTPWLFVNAANILVASDSGLRRFDESSKRDKASPPSNPRLHRAMLRAMGEVATAINRCDQPPTYSIRLLSGTCVLVGGMYLIMAYCFGAFTVITEVASALASAV